MLRPDDHRVRETGETDDRPYGAWADAPRPRSVLVQFVDGPWHGIRGRYVDVDDLPPMTCPGGSYRFDERHDLGVIYTFVPDGTGNGTGPFH
jgi:hypothetical protein